METRNSDHSGLRAHLAAGVPKRDSERERERVEREGRDDALRRVQS